MIHGPTHPQILFTSGNASLLCRLCFYYSHVLFQT